MLLTTSSHRKGDLSVLGIVCITRIDLFSVLKENFWISYLAVLILAAVVLYQAYNLRKARLRKNFIKKFSENQGPFSPRNILTTLLYNLPDFIYVKDNESRYLFSSRQLAESLGKNSPEEMTGKTDHDFYPGDLADEYRKTEIEIMASGKPIIGLEEKSINAHKEEIWINTTKIPVRDPDGNIIGIVGIGKDITEIKDKEKQLSENRDKLQELNTRLEERQEEILQQHEEIQLQSEKFLEEKNLLLTLINSMPDNIFIKDRKSRFIIGNIHVAKIMGASSPEVLTGKTDFDFYDKDLASEYFKDEQELMAKGESLINKEERGFNEQQEEVIVSTTKVPVKDDKGNVIGLVGIGRDITRQKNVENAYKEKTDALQEANVMLEERQEEIQQQSEELKSQSENLLMINEELEKLSLVASKTENVIVIMDGEGNFEWANEGFVNRYGMTLQQYIKEKGGNLLENSSNPEIGNIFNEIKESGKAVQYIARTKIDENDYMWSQTTMSPILDNEGNILRLIAIDSDITKLKEAEIQIEEQRDELTRLNVTKDKFFSIIAHDLKNPFHSIMGFSDLLSKNYDAIDNKKKKEFIKLINESSAGAFGLLENLLNWARTQTNRIKYNPVNLNIADIAKEVIQILSVNAENKNVKLILADDFEKVLAYADYNMIFTVLRNLMSNALKFTESGGTVKISGSESGDKVKISVSDTGVGMSAEDRDKLFRLDEFHTTSGTEGEAGTGLGLIVCREFILIHGGDIEVESEKGKGSTFSFTLSREKADSKNVA